MLVRRLPTVTFRLSKIDGLSSGANKCSLVILLWRELYGTFSRIVADIIGANLSQPINVLYCIQLFLVASVLDGHRRYVQCQRQRVHSVIQFIGQHGVHQSMTLDPGRANKGSRRHADTEVSLPPGARAGVAGMLVRFILDFEALGGECRRQLRNHRLFHVHPLDFLQCAARFDQNGSGCSGMCPAPALGS
jgi:hypothetical protein